MTAAKKQIRIMVFGTFDVLHKGHINLFEQARKLSANSYLIVSVARDTNVARIKGKEALHNEKQRAALVKFSRLADRVVLGAKTGYIKHILAEKPDIIALGYDQTAYTEGLAELLPKSIKIIKLKAFRPDKFKSSKFKKLYDL